MALVKSIRAFQKSPALALDSPLSSSARTSPDDWRVCEKNIAIPPASVVTPRISRIFCECFTDYGLDAVGPVSFDIGGALGRHIAIYFSTAAMIKSGRCQGIRCP